MDLNKLGRRWIFNRIVGVGGLQTNCFLGLGLFAYISLLVCRLVVIPKF